jgi:hypothetical protein
VPSAPAYYSGKSINQFSELLKFTAVREPLNDAFAYVLSSNCSSNRQFQNHTGGLKRPSMADQPASTMIVVPVM